MREEDMKQEMEQSLWVRNLARDPESRVKRRLRPGNKLGFVFSDGRRIRRAGPRKAELAPQEVRDNLSMLEQAIAHGFLEIQTRQGRVLTPEQLNAWAQGTLKNEPKPELTRVNSPPPAVEAPEAPVVAPKPPPAPEPDKSPEPVVAAAESVSEDAESPEMEKLGGTLIPAGKHQGKTLKMLMDLDPEYYENLPRNLSKHPEIIEAAVAYADLVGEEE